MECNQKIRRAWVCGGVVKKIVIESWRQEFLSIYS
jgi:hypothetical protein